MNHTFIDPQVLQQINQSNHPLATLTLHSNKLPLSISLETATIQYMMLSPNNDGKHHNLKLILSRCTHDAIHIKDQPEV
ncbi:Uncharacterised protein [Staphylococcus gallinarum]|uniref:Uncharacterized protein n=1 Tax=Staphylococcus gallinarum TaxID=1293 RepID=A0A380FNP7_STAGA|nr:Uncharacterised protein [Staphylococcus gallinarum]